MRVYSKQIVISHKGVDSMPFAPRLICVLLYW